MLTDQVGAQSRSRGDGLSCYTANLRAYLAPEWDADTIIARSVRIALAIDSNDHLVFSHHEPSLDLLPDRTALAYVGCDDDTLALQELGAEVAAHGRVLVVVDHARLPWSVGRGSGSAPHWLLVDGVADREWHVIDDFTALLGGGEQRPFAGWIADDVLCDAMGGSSGWELTHHIRSAMAFGKSVDVPSRHHLLLRRHGGSRPCAERTGRCFLEGDAVLEYLAERYLEREIEDYVLDDLWAVAGHRRFALRWWAQQGDPMNRAAVRHALFAWGKLPQALRFAVESAARGKPRRGLVQTALGDVRTAERQLRLAIS